jgi:hypothetical protein
LSDVLFRSAVTEMTMSRTPGSGRVHIHTTPDSNALRPVALRIARRQASSRQLPWLDVLDRSYL